MTEENCKLAFVALEAENIFIFDAQAEHIGSGNNWEGINQKSPSDIFGG